MEGGTCLSRGKFLTADNAQLYHFRLDEREREKFHFPKLYRRHRLSKRKGKIINYICFNYLERREEQVEVASNSDQLFQMIRRRKRDIETMLLFLLKGVPKSSTYVGSRKEYPNGMPICIAKRRFRSDSLPAPFASMFARADVCTRSRGHGSKLANFTVRGGKKKSLVTGAFVKSFIKR